MKKIGLFLLFLSVNFASNAMDVPENVTPIVRMPKEKALKKILKDNNFKHFDKKAGFSKKYAKKEIRLRYEIADAVKNYTYKYLYTLELKPFNDLLICDIFALLLPICLILEEPNEEN